MKNLLILLAFVSASAYGQSIGYWRYDTVVLQKVGGNSELKIMNATRGIAGGVLTNMGNGRTAFVTPAATTKAVNGVVLTASGDTVILGGALNRYTAIVLNGFPLTFNRNGINNASKSDSDNVRFTNNTLATNILDSMTSPGLDFKVQSKPVTGASQPVYFRIDEFATSGFTTGGAYLRIRSKVNNAAWTTIFAIGNTGLINNTLNIQGNPIGTQAGTGTSNMSWGNGALDDALLTGTHNIGIGVSSLTINKVGRFNVAVGGGGVLEQNDSSYNTAIGYQAMHFNTTGEQNTAIGVNALLRNTTAIKNTAVGAGAGENTTTGGFNTPIGEDALLQNTTGTDNVGHGWLAWSQNRTGSYNIGLGNSTGRSVMNGNYNIMIGHNTGFNGSQNDTLDNSILIGHDLYSTVSNEMILGASDNTRVTVNGITYNTGAQMLMLVKDTVTNRIYHQAIPSGGATPTLQAVTTAGNVTTTSVGIGVATPAFKLDVETSATGDYVSQFRNTHPNGYGLQVNNVGTNSTHHLLLLASGSPSSIGRFWVMNNGNLYSNGIASGAGTKAVRWDGVSGQFLVADTSTGGGGSTNTSVGSGFKVAINATNNIKSLANTYGLIIDSTTSNQVGFSVDSSIFVNKAGQQIIVGNKTFTGTTTVSSPNNSFRYTTSIDNSGNFIQDANVDWIIRRGGANKINIAAALITLQSGVGLTVDGAVLYVDQANNRVGALGSSPTSTLYTAGSFGTLYAAKTTTYPITETDHTIEATSGTFTTTLPTAVGISGRQYTITNSGSGVVTLATTSSQTFVNYTGTPTTLALNQFYSTTVVSNGANWLVVVSRGF